MVEIVLFTGWVTGSGDDHTLRVLLRYYEFLLLFVPLFAIIYLGNRSTQSIPVLIRWALGIVGVLILTPVSTGFFGTLVIQIADAPSLAGLVVNLDLFNVIMILSFIALLVFATFPRFSAASLAVLLPITLIGTGWNTQDQYQNFRGTPSAEDLAGKFVSASFAADDLGSFWILGPRRFEATNIAFWIDSPDVVYDLYLPNSQVDPELAPPGARFAVSTQGIELTGAQSIFHQGPGFIVYELPNK